MRKKVLFINSNLTIDGANISLINLLKTLDYNKYDVRLGLFTLKGELLSEVPNEVEVFILDENLEILTLPMVKSISKLFSKKEYNMIIYRILFSIKTKLKKQKGLYLNFWNKSKPIIKYNYSNPDIAISYQDNWSRYYLIDKVKAKKKVVWNHTTLNDIDVEKERDYFNKAQLCVTVSSSSEKTLKRSLNEYDLNYVIQENIILKDEIKKKSIATSDLKIDKENFNIVTVARLSYIKGVDLIPNAAYFLKKNNLNFKWYIVGEGPEYKILKKKINKLNLNNHIILVGKQINPYPYMENANVYVQPSRSEAKSIAVEEAKVLGKIVVCTNYPTVSSQISDGETGFIVNLDSEAISKKILDIASGKHNLSYIVKKNQMEEINRNNSKSLDYIFN